MVLSLDISPAGEVSPVVSLCTASVVSFAPHPLIAAANDYLADGKTPVAWCFPTMPSDTWKNNVGGALLKYAQGTGSWEDVQKAFVDGWKTEKEAAKSAQ